MEGKFELQFEDGEYYLVDGNTNDTVATTDKVLLKEYDGYMKKLSLKNCEAVANGYDLYELSRDYASTIYDGRTQLTLFNGAQVDFIAGAKAILEILGDKKFSEKDMRRALSAGLSIGYGRQFEIENKQVEIDSYIKSLQQTEWDVIVEMEKEVGTKLHDDGREFFMIDGTKPKLDAENCLILKRK